MAYTHNDYAQPVGLEVVAWSPPDALEASSITGHYCRLERLDAGRHGDDLWAAWQQPDSAIAADVDGQARWTYLGGRPFADLSGCRRWLAEMSADSALQCFAVIDQADERAVGMGAYLNDVPADGRVEIGHLSFSSRMAGSRVSSEALMLMMAEAFGKGYRRLEWKCDALNAASRRAAERLGFRYEGIFRQHCVVAGRNRDTAWYAVIDSEWPAIAAAQRRWLAPDNFDADGHQRQGLASLMLAQEQEG
ncbi:GNAT family protein [Halomonas sabkhae]|uniref:GNAT family N-acetyltransferase n=1 Tax=Halomonas sabkhae TaxID=626223 RepID=UPI0025B2D9B0|nr:GNAT family protein [Halomonas sabkhae]MDN3525965.1 GNAT family protein [Halomonas sabkhae]